MDPVIYCNVLYGVVLYPSLDINSPLPDLAPSVSGSWSNDPEGIMGQKCEKNLLALKVRCKYNLTRYLSTYPKVYGITRTSLF